MPTVPLEISCDSDKCRYDCNVMPGLVKDFPVEITIVMTLNPEQNAFELFKRENFEIVTKLLCMKATYSKGYCRERR